MKINEINRLLFTGKNGREFIGPIKRFLLKNYCNLPKNPYNNKYKLFKRLTKTINIKDGFTNDYFRKV